MNKEPIELHNKIYYGDNLTKMKEIPDKSVDLIYLDPPFFTGTRFESEFGDGELEIATFEDIYEGGIKTYILVIQERAIEMKRILKSTGSIFFHCDHHASHYIKVMMDEVFGNTNFRSEIIWQDSTSALGQTVKTFSDVHDTIFFYSKTNKCKFNISKVSAPRTTAEIDAKYPFVDNIGRYEKAPLFTSMGVRPNLEYEYKGYLPKSPNRWRVSRDTLEELDSEGKIVWSKTGKPSKKRYSTKDTGIRPTNVWTDIPAERNKEYPTQKPIELLKRIIMSATEVNDMVMDPFMGSGRTIEVAYMLGRRFTGIELSPIGVRIAAKKIQYPEHKINFGNLTKEEIAEMTPGQFQQRVCDEMLAVNTAKQKNMITGGDGGVDGWIGKDPRTTGFTGCPIEVKQHKISISVVDRLAGAMKRNHKHYGFIIGLGISQEGIDAIKELNTGPAPGRIKIVMIDATFLGSSLQYDKIFDNTYHRHIRGPE